MARSKRSDLFATIGLVVAAVATVLLMSGCARYNTFYNAEKAFKEAEHLRDEKIKAGEDISKPTAGQSQSYQLTIKKCLKLMENYPGHSLTDDALFLMGKSHHRLQQYNSSIEQFDLLFKNFPANSFMEESLYLQAANHMFTGDVARSNGFLQQLRDHYPTSRFQAEAFRVQGENAFSLERWQEARTSFTSFVETFPDDERVGEVGLMLGRSLWKLHEYDEAARRLEQVVNTIVEREDAFDAQLLLARCWIRQGRTEQADEQLNAIVTEAEVYEADGMVSVVRAENHIAKGEPEEAKRLLSTMPTEWMRGDVLPLVGEIMGELQLEAWELDEAAVNFRNASRNSRITSNPERIKRLSGDLQVFNQTIDRLEGAREEDRPSLLLTQANILSETLDRPRMALDRYLEVSTLTEQDSLSAVRGMFGAAVMYRNRLALPDSADLMESRLLETYPASPQALVLRDGSEADLYSYLLELEREQALLLVAEIAAEGPVADDSAPTSRPTVGPSMPEGDSPATGRYSRWRLRKLEWNAGLAGRSG